MPGGDRTGPFNEGPGTGRGLGYCGGNAKRRFMKSQQDNEAELGKTFGRGRGHRHGKCHGFKHLHSDSDKP